MRFTLLCASSALAASLVLSACSSGGGSQAIPGGSQSVMPMGMHSGLHMVVETRAMQPQAACPKKYSVACFTVPKPYSGKPASYAVTYCVTTSGSSCSSNLAPGRWKWQPGTIYLIKGHVVSTDPKGKLSPTTGNPVTETITVDNSKKGTDSAGKIKWETTFEATAASGPYKGSTVGAANDVGIATCNENKAGTACS